MRLTQQASANIGMSQITLPHVNAHNTHKTKHATPHHIDCYTPHHDDITNAPTDAPTTTKSGAAAAATTTSTTTTSHDDQPPATTTTTRPNKQTNNFHLQFYTGCISTVVAPSFEMNPRTNFADFATANFVVVSAQYAASAVRGWTLHWKTLQGGSAVAKTTVASRGALTS